MNVLVMTERVEALMRIVVAIISGIILGIWKMLVQILAIVHWFIVIITAKRNKEIAEFSSEAMRLLFAHSWPGNVRELENSVEHAAVLAKGGRIEVSDLPGAIQKPLPVDPRHKRRGRLAENERELLQQVLEECGWNKKEAAHRLGIGRNTLYVKLKKYKIVKPTTH